MTRPKLVALCGSARRGSFNQAVLDCASASAEKAGAEVIRVRWSDFPFPLFNQDLEAETSLPEPVRKLKSLLAGADGFLVASPEHNSSYSALLKNAIDWCSRAEREDEAPLSAFAGKTAVLFAASPGALGGLRGLFALRELFQNLRVTVFADQLAIRAAHEAISEGAVTDAKWASQIAKLTERYVDFVSRLA